MKMHNSVDSGSLQRRIPSTRLEQATRSSSGQLSVQQRERQQQETQNSEHLRQQHTKTNALWQLERNGSNKSELERHCDLQNRISALAAVAQVTNSRLAEVSGRPAGSSFSSSVSISGFPIPFYLGL